MAFVVVMASLIGACGGGEDEPGDKPAGGAPPQTADNGEAKRVRAVVREALTTKDPGACTRLVTQRALEQFTFQRGRKALAECREDADEVGAKTVAIGRIAVDGARAEADIEPRGGTLPLKEATFALVKDGGGWKIDRLTAGTLDRPAFMRVMRKQLRDEPDDLGEANATCVADALKQRKDAEIMRLFLDGDARVLAVPSVVCAIRSQIPQSQATAGYVACVTRAATRELTTGALGREIAREADLGMLETARVGRVFEDIAARCVRFARPGSSAGGVS
jgi:hypothetical protein